MENFKLVVIADPGAVNPTTHMVINFDNAQEADEYQTDLISRWLSHSKLAKHLVEDETVSLCMIGKMINKGIAVDDGDSSLEDIKNSEEVDEEADPDALRFLGMVLDGDYQGSIRPINDIDVECTVSTDDDVELDEDGEYIQETYENNDGDENETYEEAGEEEKPMNCKDIIEFELNTMYDITIEIENITTPPTENLEVLDFIMNYGCINLTMPQIDPQLIGDDNDNV